MIKVEFEGYIDGKALKYYDNVSQKKLVFMSFGLGFAALYPTVLCVAISTNDYFMFKVLTASIIPLAILLWFSPQMLTKKQKRQNTPKRLYMDKRFIFMETEISVYSYVIKDVKRLVDYGEFYEIVFRFGKGMNFVCQKNKLKIGTLEKFESYFEGKIVRRNTPPKGRKKS